MPEPGASGAARVRIERLPPERLERFVVVGGMCCSSCCCCCCCLHTLGGLVGAAMGSVWAVAPKAVDAASAAGGQRAAAGEARSGAAITVAVHWTVVVALSVTAFVLCSLADMRDGIWIGLAAVVLGMPVFQLAAFFVGLVLAPLFPVPDKLASVKALGKIVLVSFLGSVVGALLLGAVLVVVLAAS